MRRRGPFQKYWWLLLLMILAVGPVLLAIFLGVSVSVLASVRGLAPGPTPFVFPTPAPVIPSPSGLIQLTVSVVGDGEVYLSPQGGNCPPGQTCTFNLDHGEQVNLAAVAGFSAGSNAQFQGWAGDCSNFGGDAYPQLVMQTSLDCVARFTGP